MLIVESQSLDVYRNLALEEYLMDEVRNCGAILFLWRSECAVVMGKNQNPWRECRLDLMEQANHDKMARRMANQLCQARREGLYQQRNLLVHKTCMLEVVIA